MIICRECGNHNGDADTFCGSCGSFLEWTGEKTTPTVSVEAVEEAEPEIRHRPTLLQRIAGVIAPPPGGTAVDTGVIRVSDGSARGPGGRPGPGPGSAGPRPGPPGTGGSAAPLGPRPGSPGTGGSLGPPGIRSGPPGLRPGPRSTPPGVAGAPSRPAGPPGVRSGPPGSAAASDARPGPPATAGPAGVRPAGPVRRLPPPPPGVANARLPGATARPPGGEPADRPEATDVAVADDAPEEAPDPVSSGPSRQREALAAPHTRSLVATDAASTGPGDRTATGRTSGRPRAGGPVDSAPDEVTPQPVRPRTTSTGRRAPTRRLQPGDLVCGECGEGNPPTRRFCSRCGDSLRTAEVVRRRWWQRLLPRRGPKVTEAGVRPGTPGGGAPGGAGGVLQTVYQRVNGVAAVLLFALGIAYLVYPPLRERVNAVVVPPVRDARAWVDRKLNPRFVAARPVEVTGSESVRGHGPDLTVDQYRNTHWQVRWNAERPPTVTLRFGGKVDLERLIVIAGTAENYTASHRPAKLHLVWSTNRSDTLTIQDTGEPQTLTLTAAKGVTSVQIQVTDVYRAGKGTDVAVSELEFFARE
ncbi:NADase-type glycan-binding domain-containing protein [Micromonospora sagamiensis]|uniref:Zinc ribbon domain-containing protein n=1 Tax=Micromonospora sagamiensis TaxID=47875 RepID=A0A562WML1_9ACTN|nr:hypothetical protein [Micromonospora sagamiensis]TWJ31097.1 hypothetical protein JD81_04649 [Micromonospora sagamiensis]BCL15860.1 hypothetical protein GCM10017556_35990 [Micromonospora sagamiensis]